MPVICIDKSCLEPTHLLGVPAAAKDGVAEAVLRRRASVREVLQEALRAPIERGAPLAPPAALALDQGRISLGGCPSQA